jgi:hypothetical protein
MSRLNPRPTKILADGSFEGLEDAAAQEQGELGEEDV